MSYDPSACTLSSTQEFLKRGFITYPNPSKDQLNLHVDATTISSYQITDYLGRIILSEDINNQTIVKVNVSKLMIGLYSVNVLTPFGEFQKTIMIK